MRQPSLSLKDKPEETTTPCSQMNTQHDWVGPREGGSLWQVLWEFLWEVRWEVRWEVLWEVLWYSPKIFTTAYRRRYLTAGQGRTNQSTQSQHRSYVGKCESALQSSVAVAPEFWTSLISRVVGGPGPLVSEDLSHPRNPAGSRCVNLLLA